MMFFSWAFVVGYQLMEVTSPLIKGHMQQAEKTGLNCWGFITGKITLIKTSKQSILINEEEVNDCDIYGYTISKWNFRMENNGEGGEWEIFTFQWMPIQKGCVCLVIQSCPTLCDPMDCSLPGSSVHRDFPGKVTGVDCHALFQRIFPTQGLTPGLPYCRRILHHLSHQGSPIQEGSCLQSPNML